MRVADITEKIAFVEGYADLGDSGAVGVLDKLLNARGLIGRKEPSEVRAAAALALGRIGTPDARKSLEVSSRDDDAVVRSAVSRALRGNREADR
jgi:HEAT repeat protein